MSEQVLLRVLEDAKQWAKKKKDLAIVEAKIVSLNSFEGSAYCDFTVPVNDNEQLVSLFKKEGKNIAGFWIDLLSIHEES